MLYNVVDDFMWQGGLRLILMRYEEIVLMSYAPPWYFKLQRWNEPVEIYFALRLTLIYSCVIVHYKSYLLN